MNKEVMLALLRHALTVAAGGLVTTGYIDADTADQLSGGVIAVIAIGWSIWDKRVKAP